MPHDAGERLRGPNPQPRLPKSATNKNKPYPRRPNRSLVPNRLPGQVPIEEFHDRSVYALFVLLLRESVAFIF